LLVGKEAVQLASYSLSLRQLAATLAVDNSVIFTGAVTDAQLKAYYLAADFFMLTSHHEGFCVPLVEAMALKLPIITCDSSAIPATVGKAGLVWKERNPYLLAQSIDYLNKNEALGVELGLMGRKRYKECFSNDQIAEDFLDALTEGGVI
jgi:glycosyltransferase involved in cell wall biosynthesis